MKILVTYDFLVTSFKRGELNQLRLLNVPISILKKLGVDVFEGIKTFDQIEFYNLINLARYDDTYTEISLKQINDLGFDYLKESLKNIDLLIGFELTQNTRDVLDYLKIRYIDIWLSPIRFYKDILFEFYSNDKKINTVLQSHCLDDNLLFKKVKKLNSHCSLTFKKPNIENNSCLIIGQVAKDKALLKNNSSLSLVYFIDDLKKLSLRFNKLYLMKHPLVEAKYFDKIMDELRVIENIELLKDINTYHLLTLDEIKCVASISSSVVTEAKYFGKETIFFHKPVVSRGYSRIFRELFDIEFWKEILDIKSSEEFNIIIEDNFFRLKYNLLYSYDKFLPIKNDKISYKDKYNILIRFNEFVHSLDKKNYILYGFGSIGRLIFPHIKHKLVAIIDLAESKNFETFESIPIININGIKEYPNVSIIISPFIYSEDIVAKLEKFDNEIILIDDL